MTSIFTKIINREISSEIVYEDEKIIVIKDMNPQAKIHLLIIPKKEIKTINDLNKDDENLIYSLFEVAKKLARDMGISNGYKLLFNVGEKYQEVMHIHMHFMSNI